MLLCISSVLRALRLYVEGLFIHPLDTKSSALASAAPAAPLIVLCVRQNNLMPMTEQCSILPTDTAMPLARGA